jgi:hypothetical protein
MNRQARASPLAHGSNLSLFKNSSAHADGNSDNAGDIDNTNPVNPHLGTMHGTDGGNSNG